MQKTTLNATEMKRHNRSLVLMHVREQGCSRIEIARRTGLTRAGQPSLYEVALYDMEVSVRRDGGTEETFALRRAGYEAVRTLSEIEE